MPPVTPQYPVFGVASASPISPRPAPSLQYKPAPLFDFARGDFQRDGAGRIITADGHVAWAQRSIKRILTRRRSSPLYRPEFGTALDQDLRQPTRSLREATVIGDVRGQLEQDPQTLEATDFAFSYTARSAYITCRLRPASGAPVDVGFPSLYTQV